MPSPRARRPLSELLTLPDGALVDADEAALLLAIPRKTLENRRWLRGDPPYRKLGVAVRYEIGVLRRYRGDPPASAA